MSARRDTIKKGGRIVAASVLALLSVFIAFGCGNKTENVVRLAVAPGFPARFSLDEEPNYANGTLYAYREDGTYTEVGMRSANITGFDSGVVGKRTMRFVYRGQTAEYEYEITYPRPVNTHTRITARVEEGEVVIALKTGTLDIDVYAAAFTLEPEKEEGFALDVNEAFSTAGYAFKNGTVRVTLVSTEGLRSKEEVVLARVKGVFHTAAVTDILFSDGERDYIAPDFPS